MSKKATSKKVASKRATRKVVGDPAVDAAALKVARHMRRMARADIMRNLDESTLDAVIRWAGHLLTEGTYHKAIRNRQSKSGVKTSHHLKAKTK